MPRGRSSLRKACGFAAPKGTKKWPHFGQFTGFWIVEELSFGLGTTSLTAAEAGGAGAGAADSRGNDTFHFVPHSRQVSVPPFDGTFRSSTR